MSKHVIPFEILREDGSVCRDKEEVLSHWSNYYKELYNTPANDLTLDNEPEVMKSPSSVEPSAEICEAMNCPISWAEVTRALKFAKLGKSHGYDELPLEALRSNRVKQFLLILFNKCFESSSIPVIWSKGIIVPIPKCFTKDNRIPGNTRGLTIASAVYKLYCSILNQRLEVFGEQCSILLDEQNGFRKSRSCIDHIFTLTQIVESRLIAKRSTFIAYVDFSKAYDTICREKLWFKLDKLGITSDSKFSMALQSLYQNVQCAVRLNKHLSNWFDVNVGLKQGCLLSPGLFNLYINDLACKIKSLNKGVRFRNEEVSILMYADDLVLMAENETDLQDMLDALAEWCETWGMNVNDKKTKVMHFRKKGRPSTTFNFKCGNKVIDVISQYKYLGLMIDEFLDFDVTAKHVAQSAHRALGLLIAKDKSHGGFTYEVFTKLYEVMVDSIISYGAGIWGNKVYSCINAVQNRACRYFLGLGKKSPNLALQGDMGWRLPEDKQMLCVVRLWLRLCNIDNSYICRKVFMWCKMQASLGKKNWFYNSKKYIQSLGFNEILNTEGTLEMKDIKEDFIIKQKELREELWLKAINMDRGRHGGNKLRTYKMFKYKFGVEPYVKVRMPKKHRKVMAQFRAGVAPINVELMRYGNEKTPLQERKCIHCKESVEDECHVIAECPLYDDIRTTLFQQISSHVANFMNLSALEKTYFILGDVRHIRSTAKALFEILQRRRNLILL